MEQMAKRGLLSAAVSSRNFSFLCQMTAAVNFIIVMMPNVFKINWVRATCGRIAAYGIHLFIFNELD
jgi:hypothetical protein